MIALENNEVVCVNYEGKCRRILRRKGEGILSSFEIMRSGTRVWTIRMVNVCQPKT